MIILEWKTTQVDANRWVLNYTCSLNWVKDAETEKMEEVIIFKLRYIVLYIFEMDREDKKRNNMNKKRKGKKWTKKTFKEKLTTINII